MKFCLFQPINIKHEHWLLLVLYPKLGEAIYFYNYLSFSDISKTLEPFFQYISCYCKLHNIEKNWKIVLHTLTPQQKKRYTLRRLSLFECIQSFDASG